MVKLREARLDLLALGLQRADPVADKDWIDALLDRVELALDLPLQLGEPTGGALALIVLLAADLGAERGELAAEVVEAVGAEDALRDERVGERDHPVLADVLPFAVAVRLGRGVAVGDPIAAGVVVVALAALAVHPQRVVAGGAVDDAAQRIEALLRAAPPVAGVASAACPHLDLHPFEVLVGDDRLVAALGRDPLLLVAADERTLALLDRAEVEPVPVEASGVDGVVEHRADRRFGPAAGGVAFGVDVARGGGTAGPVQVVGNLGVARAGEEAGEHLDPGLLAPELRVQRRVRLRVLDRHLGSKLLRRRIPAADRAGAVTPTRLPATHMSSVVAAGSQVDFSRSSTVVPS
ncbi:MAG: hypothetical protein QM729_06175 [Solirubrobacterales bacterium]